MAYIPSECTIEQYKNSIYSADSTNRCYLSFGGTEYQNVDNKLEKIVITSDILNTSDNVFMLNNLISKNVEITIHDIDINDIIDDVELKIGTYINETIGYVYVPIGKFVLQEIPTTDNGVTTIQLRDYSVKLDEGYNAKPLIDNNGGSATKLQILQDICTTFGVTCGVSSFDGDSDLIGIYDSSINGRYYVAWIAEQAGCIAYFDRQGILRFFDKSNQYTWNLPFNLVEKYTNGENYKISKVIYESGIIKYEYPSTEATNDILYLDSANPYISNQNQINNIYNKFNNYEINSFNISKIYGNPAIDAFDLISVTNNDNITFTTLGQNELTYTGKLINSFETEISKDKKKTNVTKNSNETFKKYAKTEIDNINGEIDILSGKIVDISSTINGIGHINITNSAETSPYNITIKGELIQPITNENINGCSPNLSGTTKSGISKSRTQSKYSKSIICGDGTITKDTTLSIYQNNVLKYQYILPINCLNVCGTTSDEFQYNNGKCTIIRKVGINNTGSKYILSNTITENLIDLNIVFPEGDSTLILDNYLTCSIQTTYLNKNQYSDVFATQVSVSNQITVASDEILIESKSQILDNGNEIVASINTTTTGDVKLKGERISLEGTVTANDKFKINTDGSCETTDLRLLDGGKVIGGDGIISSLQFQCNFGETDLGWYPTDSSFSKHGLQIHYSIPNDFTITKAWVRLVHIPCNNTYTSSSGTSTYTGYARNIQLYKCLSFSSLKYSRYGWDGDPDYSSLSKSALSWENGTWSSNSYTGKPNNTTIVETGDIKSDLITGESNMLLIDTGDSSSSISSYADSLQKTARATANLYVIGYTTNVGG